MKNKIFLVLAAFLFLFSVSSAPVSASVGVKNVNIHYNHIKINADGNYVNTANEPFTINGTTYVPLREVGNILGAEVNWDAENNIIFIKSNNKPTDSFKPKVKASASVGSKKVSINYNNILINVDRKYVSTGNEPFTINGVTYVPLREISNILGAEVDWNAKNNTIIISSNINNVEPIEENEEPVDNSVDSDEPEDSSEPKDENTLFAERLFDKHGILQDVDFDKFELTGDNREVNLDIYLDLASNVDTWNALTDRNIDDWLEDIVTDIQNKFDEDTKVIGKIIRVSNRDVLIDFDQDGEENLKTHFHDANYRTGVAVKTTKPLDNSYDGKHYYVDNLDFITTAATYNENYGDLDMVLTATKDNTKFGWDKMTAHDINAYVKEICAKIINDYDGEAELNLEQINLNFKDKSNKQIALFRYDVNEEEFLR